MDGTALPEVLAQRPHRSLFPALTHLQQLEAESIHIMREVAAEAPCTVTVVRPPRLASLKGQEGARAKPDQARD